MNIPDNILDYCGSKNPEQLQTMLDEFKLMHNNLKDIDVSLPISIIEQLLITKSQGNYYLFQAEDMEPCGDGYLPDGYLLYQHLSENAILTPVLPDPNRNYNVLSRVIEDLDQIIQYLVQNKIKAIYTGTDWWNNLPVTNSKDQWNLSMQEIEDWDKEKLLQAEIEVKISHRII